MHAKIIWFTGLSGSGKSTLSLALSKILKKNKQVAILVMDSHGINKKNPFKFNIVKSLIKNSLIRYKNKFIVIKIPVVSEVVYGRKVGYKFRKVGLSRDLENISATNIRKRIIK